MNAKFFVPFETARQLKEKGYPQELATKYYDTFSGGEISLITDRECVSCVVEGNVRHPLFKRLSELYIAAPTYHEVVDWLWNKDILIKADYLYRDRTERYEWAGIAIASKEDILACDTSTDWGITREEALNAAIIKALEML